MKKPYQSPILTIITDADPRVGDMPKRKEKW
jgi:hypothetical protein